MPASKVKAFLDEHGVKYLTLRHSPAYTAQEIAASAHVPGKEMAKTVMVKLDGRMAMAVLPASYRVDFGTLATASGCDKAELASEAEFRDLFPECELGAMPPFGNLYDMEVFTAKRLAEDEEIAFNAGTHRELIRMRYEDFARLVRPRVVTFAL
ncbi:YbaK/EbsC family protein [Candidatus Fermentibacteria bacterium]|nr:YbaK/EbsC family protein [Candidatus Fermentibacteria bacterium]